MVANTTLITHFNDFTVSCHYDGVRRSPMDDGNQNCHAITVRNMLVGTQATVMIWPHKRITNTDELLYGFYQVLQGCLFGSENPARFCAIMGMPVESPEAQKYFLHFREIAAKLSQVIAHRDELGKTIRMLVHKLGIKGKH